MLQCGVEQKGGVVLHDIHIHNLDVFFPNTATAPALEILLNGLPVFSNIGSARQYRGKELSDIQVRGGLGGTDCASMAQWHIHWLVTCEQNRNCVLGRPRTLWTQFLVSLQRSCCEKERTELLPDTKTVPTRCSRQHDKPAPQ